MIQWKQISSAPKDRRILIARIEGQRTILADTVTYDVSDKMWVSSNSDTRYSLNYPTHWAEVA